MKITSETIAVGLRKGWHISITRDPFKVSQVGVDVVTDDLKLDFRVTADDALKLAEMLVYAAAPEPLEGRS